MTELYNPPKFLGIYYFIIMSSHTQYTPISLILFICDVTNCHTFFDNLPVMAESWKLEITGHVDSPLTIKDYDVTQKKVADLKVADLKEELARKTSISVNDQILSCKETALDDDTELLNVYSHLRDGRVLRVVLHQKIRVLVICGDVEKPVTINIPDTCKLEELKQNVEDKTKIPVSEQTLYCEKTPLSNDDDVNNLVKNGMALCLKRSDIIITARRTDDNAQVTIAIPRSELEKWTVKMVRECICHKFGFPLISECKHYLISGTTILEDDDHDTKDIDKENITKYLKQGSDGAYQDDTMIFTPLKQLNLATHETSTGKSIYVPAGIPESNLSNEIYKGRPLSTDKKCFQQDAWKGAWNLIVEKSSRQTGFMRQNNTQKGTVPLPKHGRTPVFELRDIIHKEFSILPKNQKIMIRDTILEDWDDEGRPILLRNYPAIYDGATIQLEEIEGKSIEVKSVSAKLSPSKNGLTFSVPSSEEVYIDPPSAINVYATDEKVLKKMVKIVSQCEGRSSDHLYIVKKSIMFGKETKSEVKKMADIKDGCHITTDSKAI